MICIHLPSRIFMPYNIQTKRVHVTVNTIENKNNFCRKYILDQKGAGRKFWAPFPAPWSSYISCFFSGSSLTQNSFHTSSIVIHCLSYWWFQIFKFYCCGGEEAKSLGLQLVTNLSKSYGSEVSLQRLIFGRLNFYLF